MAFLTSRSQKLVASFFLLVCLAGASTYSLQAQPAPPEYKIKAAFIYYFVQYVEWPTNTFADEKSPFIIGILGSNPFGSALEETVAGEMVGKRKLVVRMCRNLSEAQQCHLLFISNSEASNLQSVLDGLKGHSVLTVSDMEQFARRGGMIRLLPKDNKIRFLINVEVVSEAKLTISAKLLQLAEVVGTEKQ
ncbi:MAG: YfiR family protein [Verrucomicrobiota bacterium]